MYAGNEKQRRRQRLRFPCSPLPARHGCEKTDKCAKDVRRRKESGARVNVESICLVCILLIYSKFSHWTEIKISLSCSERKQRQLVLWILSRRRTGFWSPEGNRTEKWKWQSASSVNTNSTSLLFPTMPFWESRQ